MLNPVRHGFPSPRVTHGTLGVVHVPKTGGSAIRLALADGKRCYLGPRYVEHGLLSGLDLSVLPDRTRVQVAHREDLPDLCRGHRLVMGHYTPAALVEAGCSTIAIQLREPRARLLSLYRYWQSLPKDRIEEWGTRGQTILRTASLSLDEFLRSPLVWSDADNAMARQILGVDRPVAPPDAHRLMVRSLHSRRWRMVRRRLGIVEWSVDSQRFANRICEELGMAPTVVTRENMTRVSDDVQILDSRCLDLVDERTALDRLLLDRLMREGLAPWRPAEDLDAEWRESVLHLGFAFA